MRADTTQRRQRQQVPLDLALVGYKRGKIDAIQWLTGAACSPTRRCLRPSILQFVTLPARGDARWQRHVGSFIFRRR